MDPSTSTRRLFGFRRAAWAVQVALFAFLLITPFDNLIEVPHGVFRLLRGDSGPFDAWKAYSVPAPAKPASPKPPIDIRSLPRSSALEHAPFVGWYRLGVIALFIWFQWEFVRLSRGRVPRLSVRLLIPSAVFGLYFGAILGTWYLTILDFGGVLQAVDRSILMVLRQGGWKAALLGDWTERILGVPADLNRPWVYMIMAISGCGAFAYAFHVLRRRGPRLGSRALVVLLAASSAMSAFVAGPIDIAARTSEPSSFLTGTFVSLLIAIPMFLWSLWPLTEVLLEADAPWASLFPHAARVQPPVARRAEEYVARAHTMSIAILGLGLAGWQIGILHSNRTRLMTEARELIAVELLRTPDMRSTISASMTPGGAPYLGQRRETIDRRVLRNGDVRTAENFEVNGFPKEVTLFVDWTGGHIRGMAILSDFTVEPLTRRELPVIGTVTPFAVLACQPPSQCPGGYLAAVRNDAEGGRDYLTGIFRLEDTSVRRRLQEIGRELDLPPDALPEARANDGSLPAAKWEVWMERIYRRLYNWSVSVPLVEGLSLSTTSAIWAIALVSTCALTVLRNCLLLALQSTEADTDQPWLLLDAELPIDRLVASLWLAAIPFSVTLVSSALLVATSETFRVAGGGSPLVMVFATLGGILLLTAVNVWTALGTVAAIIELRRMRVAALERKSARVTAQTA